MVNFCNKCLGECEYLRDQEYIDIILWLRNNGMINILKMLFGVFPEDTCEQLCCDCSEIGMLDDCCCDLCLIRKQARLEKNMVKIS